MVFIIPPTLTGTTVTWDPKKQQGSFKFNDKIRLTYTLNSGYIWSDSTTGVKIYTYTVPLLKNIIVNAPKATTTSGKMSGNEGSGSYKYVPLTGTNIKLTFTSNKQGSLSNKDKITLTYTLKTGYIWSDSTTKSKTSTYTVKGLKIKVQVPNTTTTSGTMTGLEGSGNYKPAPLIGTDIKMTFTPKKQGSLSNGDKIILTYTLKTGYIWSDGITEDKTSTYTVQGLNKKVQVPSATTTLGKLTGFDGSGNYKPAPLTGTDISMAFSAGSQGHLSNEDKITLTYTLKSGYIWSDNTKADKTSTYTVKDLKSEVKKPTNSTVLVAFNGDQGQGTFSLPSYTNTIVTITKGGSGTTPSITLKNNDTIILKFVPNINYVWNTGGTTAVSLSYTVKDLKPVWDHSTNSGLTKGSNIKDGTDGTIFQDTNSNIWSMGDHSTLQVWNKVAKEWEHDTSKGLTKGSNIINGKDGTIFEDKAGNIWSMGNGARLQVLPAKNPTKWVDSLNSGLTKGSNITDGESSTIFEDTDGNIWSMGNGTKLQVLKKGADTWVSDTSKGLTMGSNITNGREGTIFEDTDGNIWSMGKGTKLQVRKKDTNTWVSDTKSGLTNGSNITSGFKGTIFQDKSGNIWSMGDGSKLQVRKKDAKKWVSDTKSGLTNGSNIIDGMDGTIFEDTDGNIWSMGNGTKLQVLKKGAGIWESSTTSGLTNGSNITNGEAGTIFEDRSGNIWSMAGDTPLQVLIP